MEDKDIELIRRLISSDEELKRLWDEHSEFERKLNKYNKKRYLTSQDEIKRREIQKLKLAGKDKIEEILSKYRKSMT